MLLKNQGKKKEELTLPFHFGLFEIRIRSAAPDPAEASLLYLFHRRFQRNQWGGQFSSPAVKFQTP